MLSGLCGGVSGSRYLRFSQCTIEQRAQLRLLNHAIYELAVHEKRGGSAHPQAFSFVQRFFDGGPGIGFQAGPQLPKIERTPGSDFPSGLVRRVLHLAWRLTVGSEFLVYLAQMRMRVINKLPISGIALRCQTIGVRGSAHRPRMRFHQWKIFVDKAYSVAVIAKHRAK